MAYASKLFSAKLIDTSLNKPQISQNAYVDSRANLENGAVIGDNSTILAGAYIGKNVHIGSNTIIHANVSIYHGCIIGDNCIIHSGTVIGADGFGFSHTKTGEHIKIYQNGNTVIEDDVEIGASCAVDRAAFGSTIIKKGVKFDNFIHIGHNCEVGEYSILVAQSGMAGSTKLGRNCVVSGQCAFSEHLTIAPFNTFTARSGITKSISQSHKVFSGYPLMEHRTWRRLQSKIAKLLS
jgi:UDP-3-O-[3-hydroxymyristoyl] glucosamine N-acyltransferase